MADIILIDQFTNQEPSERNRENTFYVRLTVEETSQVDFTFFRPLSLVIEEGLNTGIITCKLMLDDLPGSVVNIKPLEGDFKFRLTVGQDPERVMTYDLKLSKYTYENQSPGESDNYNVVLHLVSAYWEDMILKREARGWRNKRYSDVVQEILDECGMEFSFVSQTKNTIRSIIRPHWTNLELIRWMSERSMSSTDDDTFFVFAPLSGNRFFYCPFSHLIDSPLPSQLEYEETDPRAFILSGDRPNDQDDPRIKLKNFRIESDYINKLIDGASGVRWGYYDFENRRYVSGKSTYSQSNEKQLSDWAFLSSDHEVGGRVMYGHRDPLVVQRAKSAVSRRVNQLQVVKGSVNGITDVKVGEKVNILIPLSPQFTDIIFNELYAGDYIVSNKRTVIDLDTNRTITVLQFTRQGLNGNDVNNLVESSIGKVV